MDSKRICKRDRLRLLIKWRNNVRRPEGKPIKNMQTESKNESVLNPICPVRAQSKSKENQKINQKEKIKKRIREKTPKKIWYSVSVFWFKLCSRRLTERKAAILSVYNIYYWNMNIYKPCYNSFCEPAATERRSKKLTEYHRCTRSLWHGFFWPLSFDLYMDSKRICKRYRLRLVLDHESPESHEYIPCHDLQDSSDSCD